MRIWLMTASLGALALAGGTAFAADTPSGRYSMAPAGDGFVRLDTETGAMALCSRKNGNWACEPMPEVNDERRQTIERLEAENKALKEDLRRADEALGLGDPRKEAEAKRPCTQGHLELPSEQDVDKAFDYFERMLKKFRERMRQLEGPGKGATQL